jgi:hypothetical protein
LIACFDPCIYQFPYPQQCFGTLWCVGAKYLEVMIHVFPGFQDDLRSLILAALGEGLNAVVQDLGASSLHINRGKAA